MSSEATLWRDRAAVELAVAVTHSFKAAGVMATDHQSETRRFMRFTEAEQAALALAEEGTRLADANLGVSDETWAQVRKHYDDDQITALVALVALINATNRLAVIVHQKGGSYEPGMFASFTG